jgi:alpha-tubulin suppressor-like RCC1 family protein
MLIPPGSTDIELVFAISEPCGAACAPFMVAVLDSLDNLRYRWCWNHEGTAPEVVCHENLTIPEKKWHRVNLDISSYSTDSDAGKVELAVYTSGDYTHLPALEGQDGRGGTATVLIDTLVFKPNRRDPANGSLIGTHNEMLCKPSQVEICDKNAWCFDKFRCHNGLCVPAKGRCNGQFNCADDSDEVGCTILNGFHLELYTHHAKYLQDWQEDLSKMSGHDPSIRVLQQETEHDENDWWNDYGIREEFAAVWKGVVTVTHEGYHNFEFGGGGFRHLSVKESSSGTEKLTVTSRCPAGNNEFCCAEAGENCGGTELRTGEHEITLVFIHTTGSPEISLRWFGQSTRGAPQTLPNIHTKSRMTGARCSTMTCGVGLHPKPDIVSKGKTFPRICKGMPCDNQVDEAVCCARRAKSVFAGTYSTCALDMHGHPFCWGANNDGDNSVEWTRHPGPFLEKSLSVRGNYTCGVLSQQAVTGSNTPEQIDCWRHTQLASPVIAFPADRYQSVSVGGTHACALRDTGFIACVGLNPQSGYKSWSSTSAYKSVVAGDGYWCSLDLNGNAECGGDIVTWQASPPAATYKSLEAGMRHACGIYDNGTAVCWGANEDHKATAPDGSDYEKVSPGSSHTCAIKTDKSALCWGANAKKQSEPPAGVKFSDISAGGYHSCGIRESDGEVVCWGSDFIFQPDGTELYAGQADVPLALQVKKKNGEAW